SDPVDQVDVELVVAERVRRLNGAAQLVEALRGAVDRAERVAAPRLHAAAQPVEPERAHQGQAVGPERARQKLERAPAGGGKGGGPGGASTGGAGGGAGGGGGAPPRRCTGT